MRVGVLRVCLCVWRLVWGCGYGRGCGCGCSCVRDGTCLQRLGATVRVHLYAARVTIAPQVVDLGRVWLVNSSSAEESSSEVCSTVVATESLDLVQHRLHCCGLFHECENHREGEIVAYPRVRQLEGRQVAWAHAWQYPP